MRRVIDGSLGYTMLYFGSKKLAGCILSSHTRPIWTLTDLTYVLLSCLNISKYEEIFDPLSAFVVNYTLPGTLSFHSHQQDWVKKKQRRGESFDFLSFL